MLISCLTVERPALAWCWLVVVFGRVGLCSQLDVSGWESVHATCRMLSYAMPAFFGFRHALMYRWSQRRLSI